MSDDQQAPRGGDHSPLWPRNLQWQMEYEEYYPHRTETYHRSGPPTTGYRRLRSPGDINPSFLQKGGMMSLPDVGRSHLISELFAGRRGFDQ